MSQYPYIVFHGRHRTGKGLSMNLLMIYIDDIDNIDDIDDVDDNEDKNMDLEARTVKRRPALTLY